MSSGIYSRVNKNFPQNFIVKNPYIGALILLIFSFGFLMLYKPLKIQGARSLNLGLTIAVYCIIFSVIVIGSAKLIKQIPFFSDKYEWTILKELLSILIILASMGIAVYFAGFLIEAPEQRWNFSTFLDSCKKTFLIGIIPFAFFTLVNYRFLFYADIVQYYNLPGNQNIPEQKEKLIHISSQLKKEDLSFYPSHFIYAESDGNYVVFHLEMDGQVQKKMLRNSISNIEQQLSPISFIKRTHRAFIVNLEKVHQKKGNTLGYRLIMSGSDAEIPVSRQNTRSFDEIMRQLQ